MRSSANKIGIIVCFLLPYANIYAQLCTGSLGDPIVNIDFGSGTGRGPALDGSVTAYTYKASGQLMEGEYTIANSTTGLKGNAWHISNDHTGNTNGYMMVVNCATLASEGVFYTKTVTGLCPNTTYEFSAWMMNVMNFNSATPYVTFRVSTGSGAELGSYNTGSLAVTSSPTWLQYGFFFNTGTESSVVIKVLNAAPSAQPGNDLAIDDITFRACGPSVQATINGSSSVTVCAGAENVLNLQGYVSTDYTQPAYQWQINTGNGWVDMAAATTLNHVYNLAADASNAHVIFRLSTAESGNISSGNCRVYSNEVNLNLEQAPVAAYAISSSACLNQGVQFTDQSTAVSALTYYWAFGDGGTSSEMNPVHTYAQTGSYHTGLKIVSANGCSDTADGGVNLSVSDVPTSQFTATPMDTSIFYPWVSITDLSADAAWCNIDWGDGTVSNCSEDTHEYKKYGEYQIMQVVGNAAGCTDTSYIKIIKEPEYRFFIPNAFTPDGDGINEVFKPMGLGWEDYVFQVYNRWGQKIFETQSDEQGWDGSFEGKEAQIGLYVYYISYRDAVENHPYVLRGSVSLLR